MARIAVVGSMNADLTVRTERLPRGGETVSGSELEINPGGKSSNQAAAAARLGGRVGLLGLVGDDPHGELLRAASERAGVEQRWIRSVAGVATGTAMIAVDDAGENFIIISPGANGKLAVEHVLEADELFADAAVLCLCLEVDQRVVLTAAQEASRRGVRVLLNLSPSAPVGPELLAATEVLLVNEHELADLVGAEAALERAAELLAGKDIRRAVITLGAEGALVIDGDRSEHVPSVRVRAVDSTGAGDAFTGALAYRLAEGDDLVEAARFAARVGAFATTRHGAQPSYPTPAELADFLAEQEKSGQEQSES
ncbi:ribokinase [Enemella evansiae]|uniref:ribokinase n=1 Tax=Enemella evansiae TaxID=2016499 RepID=UPI000B96C986|nr:ribokinase [Enemella evansiae]PFG65672.1 ribokinase [Propionibacteriaceae bacterium ES.041]OYN96559.1 ribokinase [Enemella evansiae]OYN98626.1 ribokinase [Enemella evansiae]OYO01931.1 ribokinase [Enemella evansiae]OYO10899.1 ribokinase [Enemella evansiae]